MTMSPNLVSSQYLASSLLLPVTQAQSAADHGDDRGIDRTIRRSRPSAGRPVRLRTVAQGAGPAAPGADRRKQPRFDQSVDGADGAGRDEFERPVDAQRSCRLDAERQFGRDAADHGPVGLAGADRRGQRDLGRPVCVRRNQFLDRADGRLLFDADIGGQDRRRHRLSDRFRSPSDRPGGRQHNRFADAGLSRRSVRGALFRSELDVRLVVGFEHEHDRRDRAGADGHDLDQRQSAGFPAACPSLYDALRIRRLRAQRERTTGGRLGGDVADHARPSVAHRHADGARRNPERGDGRQQHDERPAHSSADSRSTASTTSTRTRPRRRSAA